MRKILLKTVTLVTVLALTLSLFAACGLVTTDQDRNMKQNVATVCINKDEVAPENIKKSEMIAAYMSYGYQYVSSYNYTVSKAYSTILDNLITNRVIVQQARIELGKLYNQGAQAGDSEFMTYFRDHSTAGVHGDNAIDYKNGDIESIKKFLTEYEIAYAEYQIRKSVNSVIKSYDETEKAKDDEKENETFTARTSPYEKPEAVTDEYKLVNKTPEDYDYQVANVTLKADDWTSLKTQYTSTYALNLAVYKAYKIDLSTSEKKKALGKAIKDLKKSGVIANDENYVFTTKGKEDEVLNYSYFKNSLKSQLESAVVTKYESALKDQVRSSLNAEDVWKAYMLEYDQQKFNYQNDRSAYESALESVDKDTFVVSNPYAGEKYGYVANLLIGFTDEQTELLKEYSSKAGVSEADVAAYRAQLLNYVVAKDQRATWAQSGYGEYDETTGEYTFEAKYFKSNAEDITALTKYIGKISGAKSVTEKNSDEVEETTWKFESVSASSMSFDKFVTDYLSLAGMEKSIFVKDDANTIKTAANYATDSEKIRNAFDDLIYAFGTDSGALGKYYGYVYSPETSATKYVAEFAAASKAVVEKGEGSYTIVATDYGYHIILCTKVVGAEPYTANDETAFLNDISSKNESSVAYKYYESKFDSLCSNEVSKIANKLINEYKENNVTKYKNAYSDLITEEK